MEQYSGDSFWNILLKYTLGGEGEGGVGRYLGYLVILALIYLARCFLFECGIPTWLPDFTVSSLQKCIFKIVDFTTGITLWH